MAESEMDLPQDLLRGADEIAGFLYGDPKMRRKVYHLCASSRFPAFKLGAMLHARRSVVIQWIADQENRKRHE